MSNGSGASLDMLGVYKMSLQNCRADKLHYKDKKKKKKKLQRNPLPHTSF